MLRGRAVGLAARRRRRRFGRPRPVAERLLGEREALLGRDVAGQHQDRLVRPPVHGVEAGQVVAGQPLQRARRAAGGVGERGAGVGHRRGGERGHLARLAVGDVEALQRLLARALQLLGREGGVAGDVGDDAERGGQLVRHHREADLTRTPSSSWRARSAPSASDWRAMSRAERVAVPSVTSEAVRLASPARRGGSEAAPASKAEAGGHQRQVLALRHDDPQAVRQRALDRRRQHGGRLRADRRRRLALGRRQQRRDRAGVGLRGDRRAAARPRRARPAAWRSRAGT